MLTIYRRHRRSCPHRSDGRTYRRCHCPIWVDGLLGADTIRESLKTRNWTKAQSTIAEWEAEGRKPAPQPTALPTITECCDDFLRDAKSRGLRPSTLKKYRVLFSQLRTFASDRGIVSLRQLDLAELRRFRSSWADSGISALKKLERLRAFLRFSHDSGWIDSNPASKLGNPKVTQPPTLPFTREEVVQILAACDEYPDTYGHVNKANARRLRAFVLLLRYGGMRIGDAATCAKDRLNGDRLFLYTAKTGTPVNLKLPSFVTEALNSIPSVSDRYFFWTGEGSKETVAGNWRRSLRKLFDLAGIKNAHPHRFRDTFAIELLLAGVPMERISILLGHSSIRVTERHYAPWIRARQEQLEADLERCWASDPIVLSQTKGTPDVHGGKAGVN